MKKIFKLMAVVTFTMFLGVSSPVMAQDDAGTASTTRVGDDNDDDGDEGKWGLVGLLGLLGLAGLKRRDNNDHRGTTNR